MKVLGQWGIGKELDNKHFAKNQGMELLRRDKGPSLGHLVHYYGSEEHFFALGMLPECVRHGKPAFKLQHGMSHYNYMSDMTTHPYSESKMVMGSSQHLIGSNERRREFAQNYIHAMACISNLTLLQDHEGINNVYEVYPWSSCAKLVDVGGSTGHFMASVMKRPGCEHIQGFVMDLPAVIEEAEKRVNDLGLSSNRIAFIKQDIMKPFCSLDLHADTVTMKSFICGFADEDKVSALKNCKSLFRGSGRLLIIEVCSPNPGDLKPYNGQQIPFSSIQLLSIHSTSFPSLKETTEIIQETVNKAGYKLIQIYNTFPGGHVIFELFTQ
ncbi:6-hydroxytryprostatin B O-methyltransferase [Exaiptasia diaphana]|nr:6-hydroxytryprostatin B O-methyltransferase [Exaiptasia diaphana]